MEDIFAPLDEEITSFKRYFGENNRCILSAESQSNLHLTEGLSG